MKKTILSVSLLLSMLCFAQQESNESINNYEIVTGYIDTAWFKNDVRGELMFLERNMMVPPDKVNFKDPNWRYNVWSQGQGLGKTEEEAYQSALADATVKAEKQLAIAQYFDKRPKVEGDLSVTDVKTQTFIQFGVEGEYGFYAVVWMRIEKR